jgi:hypothetical protein
MSKYQALDRLEEIQAELRNLGREAAELFRENFPSQYRQGDAYGAFTFGTSWNRFDTTLESLREAALEEADQEDYAEEY